MIRETLSFLRNEINRYLNLLDPVAPAEERVTINNVITQSGELNAMELGLSLISVEEEKVHKAQSPYKIMDNGDINLVNPEIKLNLYVLLTANFPANDYEGALSYLSHVISFFQGRQVFNHQNSPTLAAQIEKLIVELVTLTFEQQNHLWGFIGAKYIPSVLYKVRLIIVSDEAILQETGIITTINTNQSQS